ncbi:class B sortase [uncultured Gemmiger sp.]|uniref:class B sortase n=1 Tax=uncultured Gemmiger sp. TaxID=1623490 RepID=UPI0025D1D085|nr:class B sortase [uncultured Gemmiger sp.]
MSEQHHPHQQRQPAPLFAEGGSRFYDQDQDDSFPQGGGRPSRGGKPAGRRKKSKKSKGTDILYNIAIGIFALIFLVCAGLLGKRFLDDRAMESEMADLHALISEPSDQGTTGGEGDTVETNAQKFARLVELNPDFVGWISIEGTNVDFPVMQSAVENRDFYLRHNFQGEYDDYGVPYLDADCVLAGEGASNNLVIYGHHMKSGTMFGSLTNYKQASYYEEHPTIEFDTLYGDGTYEVFAAFPIDIVNDPFPYNTYQNMDEETFNTFVDEVKRRSSVDSGITPVYGDQLLTLSTCEYSVGNGRFVVCARKVD